MCAHPISLYTCAEAVNKVAGIKISDVKYFGAYMLEY
jgi:hypothetical protein